MRTCEIPHCNRQHRARGMCELHYKRWLTKSTLAPELPPDRIRMSAADIQRLSDLADAACPRFLLILHPNFSLDGIPGAQRLSPVVRNTVGGGGR